MNTKTRTPDEQSFWDRAFDTAYQHALRQNGKRADSQRITWAATRADGALAARRRSQVEDRA